MGNNTHVTPLGLALIAQCSSHDRVSAQPLALATQLCNVSASSYTPQYHFPCGTRTLMRVPQGNRMSAYDTCTCVVRTHCGLYRLVTFVIIRSYQRSSYLPPAARYSLTSNTPPITVLSLFSRAVFKFSCCTYLPGFVLWLTDQALCEHVRFMQFHAWWHILTGVGTNAWIQVRGLAVVQPWSERTHHPP